MLVQAPDHQWDAELLQLLHLQSDVGDWSALSAALVALPELPLLQQPDGAVDCKFEAAAVYIDLALSWPAELLHLTVCQAVHLWCALGANKIVVDWILHGVHFPLS